MKFGPVPVEAAKGDILAHGQDVLGRKIPKGAVLTEDDIAALKQEGVQEVITARLDENDVPEDIAARQLADALVAEPASFTLGPASVGRVNLFAKMPGLLRVNRTAVVALNMQDPGLTLATLPNYAKIAEGVMIATVKIIPYAVAQHKLSKACAFANDALHICPPVVKSVTLIETELKAKTYNDKGRRVTAARLRPFDVTLTPRCKVAHEERALAQAIIEAPGEAILILTASATSDIRDVAPAALIKAGGRLIHYGMPVDPGNLLFLGQIGEKPVIGLPGCARSPALNGADWILNRVLCGIEVTAHDIMSMGVGGLLKEMPTRPRLRET